MIMARYTLSIHAPNEATDEAINEVASEMTPKLDELEENLTDLLPEGFVATIDVKE